MNRTTPRPADLQRPIAKHISVVAVVTVLALVAMSAFGAGIATPALAQQGISDWHDLANVSDDLDGDYVLTNNLSETTPGYDSVAGESANGGNGFRPLGSEGAAFVGTFDGQGQEIADLEIHRTGENGVGLFGYAGSDSSNFSIRNLSVTATVSGGVNGSDPGDGKVGALVGQAVNGTIENVSVSGAVSSPIGDAGRWWGGVGGAVGRHLSVSTRDSYANVTVHAPDGRNIGGFAGIVNGSEIVRSGASGAVSGRNNVGGFAGIFNPLLSWNSFRSPTVTESYATGNVKSINSSGHSGTGGFAGAVFGASINTAYATGDVVARGDSAIFHTGTGGFVGWMFTSASDIGVRKSYATGTVRPGATTGGGLLGVISSDGMIVPQVQPSGLIRDSYWDIVSTNQTSAIGYDNGCSCSPLIGFDTNDGMGRAEEMTGADAPGNMTLFDFNTTWETVTDPDGYPRLANSTLNGPSRDTRSNIIIEELDIAGQGRHATIVDGRRSDLQLQVRIANLDTINHSVALTLTVAKGTSEQVNLTLTADEIPPDNSKLVTFESLFPSVNIAAGVYNVSVQAGNATATGTIAVRPDVTGDGNPARDTTGDGNLDDIDGDGSFTILDVQALFSALHDPVVQDHPALFEFAGGPSDSVSIFDVQALYASIPAS